LKATPTRITSKSVIGFCRLFEKPLRTGGREAEHREPPAFQQTEKRRELLMELERATSG